MNDLTLLNKVEEISKQSPDLKKQVGALIYCSKSKLIISTGFNRPLIPFKNKNIDYFSKEKHPYILHAEQMALNNLSVNSPKNLTLYCNRTCCVECCKRIIENGCISRVVVSCSHSDNGMFLLKEANIEVNYVPKD